MSLLLPTLGALFALVVGVRYALLADALAAFFLYQAALGLADLVTLSLRGARRQPLLAMWPAATWVSSLVLSFVGQAPWWLLSAVVGAGLLVWRHRPDMALFAAATLPVSLAFVCIALARGEAVPLVYLALLLAMGALFAWKAISARRKTSV